MNRLIARTIALVALLLIPTAVFAQKEPPHTKETKNAEKFIGLAMTRQDPAQKRQFMEQALAPLSEAIAKNPENARVWLLAGGVYAALANYASADSAFDRAVDLYPAYAEQIYAERHSAWEVAFNNAVGLINAQKTDEGIVALETAELMFPDRPEAKYYLGLFYMQKEKLDEAEAQLNATMAAVHGPLRAKLPPAALEDWDRLASNAKIKLSNLIAFRGAQLYDEQQYDSARVLFKRAREMTAASRDHLFNQLQAAYARALDLDKERAAGKSTELDNRARTLYTHLIALTDTLRTVDPRNEDIFFFSSRAHKVLSELTTETAVKAKHMDALRAINNEFEQTTFMVTDVQIMEGDSTAVVKGNVINRLLKPGATGTLAFELLGLDGAVIGSAPINFTVPAGAATTKDVKIPFEVTIPLNAALAGWRYRVQ